MMGDGPIVSVWIAVPIACAAVVAISSHLESMRADGSMPASRRRLRSANAMVMLLLTPILAYAFSMASPARPRMFVLAWCVATALLGVVILIAAADMLNTVHLQRASGRRLRARFDEMRRAAGITGASADRAAGSEFHD